jgi:hypothetical protein
MKSLQIPADFSESQVKKELPKASSTHINVFLKAAGDFVKKSRKYCQHQRLSETLEHGH